MIALREASEFFDDAEVGISVGEEELIDLIQLYRVDIRFIGEDYRDKPFTGDTLEGIEVFYNRRDHRFSSSGLKKRAKESDIIGKLPA